MDAFWLVISGTLTGAVGPGVSVLYAVYGELITERAGRINLGMEGCLLMGACFGFLAAAETGSAALGALAGLAAGAMLAAIQAYLVTFRDTNQLATGLALTLFAGGLTAYVGRDYVDRIITGLNPVAIPGLAGIPVLGEALFRQDLLAYAAYAIGPLLWFALRYTRWGLSLRAVGESAAVAFAAGRNPALLQLTAIILGGALAGLGGAQLSIGLTHTWSEGMTAGRGFIAVALVIFGLWSPLRGMLGALLFGGAVGLQLQLQSLGAPISPFLLDMLPYLLTLTVLAVWTGAADRAMPQGLKGILRTG